MKFKSHLRSSSVGVAALLALGLAAGCSNGSGTPSSGTPPVQNTVVTPAAPTATTTTTTSTVPTANAPSTNNVNAGPGGATGSNAAVADAVNKAIHANTQMTGSRVTAVVDAQGAATLTGTAQNAQQKALAASAATNTTGVTHVVNKVEISPTGGAGQTKTITKTVVVHDPAVSPAASNSDSPSTSQSTAGTDSGQTNSSAQTGDTDSQTAPPATSSSGSGG